MRFSEIIKSSFTTLRANGRRTFLTMIGIIIGISSVIAIMSLGNGFNQSLVESISKDPKGRPSQEYYFMSMDGTTKNPFSGENISHISKMDGVDEVKVELFDELFNFNMMNVSLANNEVEYLNVTPKEKGDNVISLGRDLTEEDSHSKMNYATLSKEKAEQFFGSSELALHKPLKIDGHNYTIVGIYIPQTKAKNAFDLLSGNRRSEAEIPMETYKKNTDPSKLNPSLKVFFRPGIDTKVEGKKIADYLEKDGVARTRGTYQYFDISDATANLKQTFGMITAFIAAIAAISLFIAGVGIMNMMYISVSERTKEIGIRRSLGATQKSIQWQFLLEGIAITSFGGIIGFLVGVGLSKLISNLLPFKAVTDVNTILTTVLISVLIGIIFSVFPAKSAARKNVVEILR